MGDITAWHGVKEAANRGGLPLIWTEEGGFLQRRSWVRSSMMGVAVRTACS
jgi:hypothetical protein